jgi:ZIP family zinc transporter
VLAVLAGAGATALGALPVLALGKLAHRTQDILFAFSAGLMSGIVTLQLVPEAHHSAGGSAGGVILNLVVGGGAMLLLDLATRRVLSRRSIGPPAAAAGNRRRTSIFVLLALTIHNVPEGLSVGLGYGEGVTPFGNALALAIALQNAPEGLIVAIPFRNEGRSRWTAFGLAAATGVVEPLAALAAMQWIELSAAALPSGLAFAAGAMTYVIAAEMIPESWRHGYPWEATVAAASGFLVVAVLTAAG